MDENFGLVQDGGVVQAPAVYNLIGHNIAGEWVLIDGDADVNDFVTADPAVSEEMMLTTLRRMISSLETKFKAERLLDVLEAADELVVLCDALDKAEEDEEERLQSFDEERHVEGHAEGQFIPNTDPRSVSVISDPAILDFVSEHRDYEDIEGRIVMRRRRSAASLRRGLLGDSDTIIKGLVWLLYNGDCQVQIGSVGIISRLHKLSAHSSIWQEKLSACVALASVCQNHVENATRVGHPEHGVLPALLHVIRSLFFILIRI